MDDHPVFRQGLATVLATEPDMILVGQAASGADAIAAFRRHRPDITLMDLRVPHSLLGLAEFVNLLVLSKTCMD